MLDENHAELQKPTSKWAAVRPWFIAALLVVLIFGSLEALSLLVLPCAPEARWSKARVEMGEISEALNEYAKLHGDNYPDSVASLEEWFFPNGVARDPFTAQDYMYERTSTGFRLASYGRDQKPGGDGTDCDIVYTESGLQEPSP